MKKYVCSNFYLHLFICLLFISCKAQVDVTNEAETESNSTTDVSASQDNSSTDPTPTSYTGDFDGSLTVSGVTSSSATLSWSSDSKATSYKIFQVIGSSVTLIKTLTSSDTSFSLTGLNSQTTTTYKIHAYDLNGFESETATEVSVTTLAPPVQYINISQTESIAENSSAGLVEIEVTLSFAPSSTLTVDYTTSASTATATNDYTTTSGTLTFSTSETSKTISIPIIDDSIDEEDETFTITLSNSSDGTIQNATSTVTITDDEAEPNISITSSYTSQPGETFDLTITLDRESEKDVTVNYSTIQSGTAVAGVDYTSVSNQQVTIPNNTLTQTISIETNFVSINSADKDFSVSLTSSTDSNISSATSNIDLVVPSYGTYDKSFGGDGTLRHETSGYGTPMHIIPMVGDKLYVMGKNQASGYISLIDSRGNKITSFNGTGYKDTSYFSGYDRFSDGVADVDGNLILMSDSTGNDSFDLVKLYANGNLDSSFSGNGRLEHVPTSSTAADSKAMALTYDKKIIVVGYATNGDRNSYILKVDQGGNLDTSFNTSGVLNWDAEGSNGDDELHDIVTNPDGTFYVAGVIFSSGYLGNAFVAKFLADGSLDTSFNGGSGVYNSILTSGKSTGNATNVQKVDITVLNGGDIILTVPNDQANLTEVNECQIEKILANGNRDTSFGNSGYYDTVPTSNIRSCRRSIEDKDGKIIVFGDYSGVGVPSFHLVLNSDGTLDSSYNGNTGYKTLDNQSIDIKFKRPITLTPEGKIITAAGQYNFNLTKVWYNKDNTPTVSLSDSSILENASEHYITYELSHDVDFSFILNYTTSDNTALISDIDYKAESSTSFEHYSGISGKIPLTIYNDGDIETDESFDIGFSTPTNYVLIDGQATAELTILNDD